MGVRTVIKKSPVISGVCKCPLIFRIFHVMGGHRITYRYYGMGPIRVLKQDPCLFRLISNDDGSSHGSIPKRGLQVTMPRGTNNPRPASRRIAR